MSDFHLQAGQTNSLDEIRQHIEQLHAAGSVTNNGLAFCERQEGCRRHLTVYREARHLIEDIEAADHWLLTTQEPHRGIVSFEFVHLPLPGSVGPIIRVERSCKHAARVYIDSIQVGSGPYKDQYGQVNNFVEELRQSERKAAAIQKMHERHSGTRSGTR